MNRKGAIPIIAFILMAVAGVFSLGYIGGFDTGSLTGNYNYVYKAFWGSVCCEEGALESPFIRYADDVTSFKCDAYTDECRINFLYNERKWSLGSGANVCYKINNGATREIAWDSSQTIILPYGDKISFVSCGFNQDARGYYQWKEQHRTFGLVGQENGKKFTTSSCILNSNLKERVSSDGLNELTRTGSNRCQNYLTDFIKVATKIYEYKGDEVICQARSIYAIDEEQFKDGSTIKFQGNRIKGVDCCPTESGCSEDFEFEKNVQKECSSDLECANGGQPIGITGTSYTTFNCRNGECVQSAEQEVECTNNAICQQKMNDAGAVCKNFKCEDNDEWLGHCGDGKCESIIGETPTSCPNDCGDYDKQTNWLLIIGIIILVLVLMFFFLPMAFTLPKIILNKMGVKI
jgi:hypothetical protein